jgi:hypothetical protein
VAVHHAVAKQGNPDPSLFVFDVLGSGVGEVRDFAGLLKFFDIFY